MISHPGFQTIHARLGWDDSLFHPWSGALFRFQSVDYPRPNAVVFPTHLRHQAESLIVVGGGKLEQWRRN